ncbi:DNA polymerase III subunit delta [Patescibacteria group bacterium]|nr:DNA polymerase III subunit delta [Patescibacteria group bacterium]
MADNKKQIYFWFGENDFEIHEKISQWISAFEKKYSGLNVIIFDLKENKGKDLAKEIKNALQVDSLFGTNKLVILKNFLLPQKKLDVEIEPLVFGIFEKISPTFFVVFSQKESPDRRGKLYKTIQKGIKAGTVESKEFSLPRANALESWIADRAKKYGAIFDGNAVSELSALCGGDLWQIDGELNKLANYKKGQKISGADIRLLVKGKYNEDIFELMDSISAKNKVKALKLFQDQIDSGANEIYLLTMLIRQFRILWQIKEAGSMPPDEIARQLRIHPFVVRKTMGYMREFTPAQLKEIYGQLLQMEIMIKTKSVNFEVLFDLLIAKI